jgi:hypothetical protein
MAIKGYWSVWLIQMVGVAGLPPFALQFCFFAVCWSVF